MTDIFDWFRETILFAPEDVDGALDQFAETLPANDLQRFMKKRESERGLLEFAKVATEMAILFSAAASIPEDKDEDFDVVIRRVREESKKDDNDMKSLREFFLNQNESVLESGEVYLLPQIMDRYRTRVKHLMSCWVQ